MGIKSVLSIGFFTLSFGVVDNLSACADVNATCRNGEKRLLNFKYNALKAKCEPMTSGAMWTLGGLKEFCSTRGGVAYDNRIPSSGDNGNADQIVRWVEPPVYTRDDS